MWAFSTKKEKDDVSNVIDQLNTLNGKQSEVISNIQTIRKYNVEGCGSVEFKNSNSEKDSYILDISTAEQL